MAKMTLTDETRDYLIKLAPDFGILDFVEALGRDREDWVPEDDNKISKLNSIYMVYEKEANFNNEEKAIKTNWTRGLFLVRTNYQLQEQSNSQDIFFPILKAKIIETDFPDGEVVYEYYVIAENHKFSVNDSEIEESYIEFPLRDENIENSKTYYIAGVAF